jgi:ectoine hydroxylase-related dioxygenase (phytanoyl-CoA dioxygenase family)
VIAGELLSISVFAALNDLSVRNGAAQMVPGPHQRKERPSAR